MTHEDFVLSRRIALRTSLEAFIAGEIAPTEASRAVCSLRDTAELACEDLLIPFVAFESMTDAYPLGAARGVWSAAVLDGLDGERIVLENSIRAELVEASRALLAFVDSAIAEQARRDT